MLIDFYQYFSHQEKKVDALTHARFGQEVRKHERGGVLAYFWTSCCVRFALKLEKSSSDRSRQAAVLSVLPAISSVLERGLENFDKLNKDGKTTGISATEKQQLASTLDAQRTEFIDQSFTRILTPINHMFPKNSTNNLPSGQEIQQYMQKIDTEVSTASPSPELARDMAKSVRKAVTSLIESLERAVEPSALKVQWVSSEDAPIPAV
tara:strand:+ start:7233 stop:7856 length:624 start_codon:yes stop_codon:yes gene_type:complete